MTEITQRDFVSFGLAPSFEIDGANNPVIKNRFGEFFEDKQDVITILMWLNLSTEMNFEYFMEIDGDYVVLTNEIDNDRIIIFLEAGTSDCYWNSVQSRGCKKKLKYYETKTLIGFPRINIDKVFVKIFASDVIDKSMRIEPFFLEEKVGFKTFPIFQGEGKLTKTVR